MQQLNLIGEEQGTPLFSQPAQAQKRIPFADCRVEADSVRDFIARYYKPERLYDSHFPGYTELIVTSRTEAVERDGYCIIGRHESKTGQVVAWPTLA